ncbi:unnamed protein product, partial [Lymnaea stagnalis]
DLSLYTSQINAVHKPVQSSSQSPGRDHKGGVSKSHGSLHGYGHQAPPETSGYHGYNQPTVPESRSGYYGYSTPRSGDPLLGPAPGYYGRSNPSRPNDVLDPPYSVYGKPVLVDASIRPGYLEYNKSRPSDAFYNYDTPPTSSVQHRHHGTDRARSVEPVGYKSINKDPVSHDILQQGRSPFIYTGHVFGVDDRQSRGTGYPSSRGVSHQHEIATSFLSSDGQPSYSSSRHPSSDKSRH